MDYPIKTLQQLRPILVGFRKQAGLSQAAIAGLLGITQQSYAKIEANPATTSVERLFTILRLLGVEIVLKQNIKAKTEELPAEISSKNNQTDSNKALTAPQKTKNSFYSPVILNPWLFYFLTTKTYQSWQALSFHPA